MTILMTKNEFMERLRSARSELEALLSEHGWTQDEVGADGLTWTFKDIVAHIGWYETEMVNVLRQHTLQGSDWWDLPLNERNAVIYASTRNDDLAGIVAKEIQVYRSLLELLEDLDGADLNDPLAFKGMPPEWQPWKVISSNTYEHYLDHLEQIKVLLNKQVSEEMKQRH